MRTLVAGAILLLAGCADIPIPQSEIATARAALAPQAAARCNAFGFGPSTTPPIAACQESAILAGLEARYGWERMRATGLHYFGTEEMEGIALCVANGITPADPRMPGCMQAQTTLVIQNNRRRAETLEAQRRAAVSAAILSRPVIVQPLQPPPVYTPPPRLQTTCYRYGNMINCN